MYMLPFEWHSRYKNFSFRHFPTMLMAFPLLQDDNNERVSTYIREVKKYFLHHASSPPSPPHY